MNRTDYSRPSGFARWGWCWAAIVVIGGLPNLIMTVQEPTTGRILASLFTFVATALCVRLWRVAVREDREHRALMVRLTEWRTR